MLSTDGGANDVVHKALPFNAFFCGSLPQSTKLPFLAVDHEKYLQTQVTPLQLSTCREHQL